MRKIIQLLDIPASSTSQGCLVALCNDGSVWYMQGGKWSKEVNEIPQHEPKQKEAK